MPLALGLSPTGWSRWSGPTESWGGGSLRQKVFLSFSQRQSDRAVQMNCTTFAAREAFYLLY